MNSAVDEYYSKGHGEVAKPAKKEAVNPKKIEQLFASYKDASTNKIEVEGIQKFYDDLGVDPMNVVTLILSKHMQAETMGFYTFEEFERGFKALGVTSIPELKNKLPSLHNEL